MSSSGGDHEEPPHSPPFRPAQQPADQDYAQREDTDFDSASEHLPDAPSDESPTIQSFQRESSLVDDSLANQFSGEDNLDEDSAALPSRPNKYRGPPSTWRNWTAPERDLGASLDQLQAKDLSVHLYNSFKLRQRNRIREPGPQTQTPKILGEANEESNWVPPKIWAAWPLPPDIVPREHEERRWEEDAVLSRPHQSSPRRPGQHLQEMLIAQILRIAKERFYERQREGAQLGATTLDQEQQHRSLGRDSSGRFSAKHDHEIPSQKPVLMADDARASKILQATVQHMMTKLDDLLLGLHHARSAYSLAEDSDADSQSQTSERPTSRGRPKNRKRKRSKKDEDAEESRNALDSSRSDSKEYRPSRRKSGSQRSFQRARSSSRRSRSQKFRNRERRLGLRDWSDVVGVASMIGWHQNLVGNATARCATLFDEAIKFRTLEEGKNVQEEHLYLPGAPAPASNEHGQSHTWREREGRSNRFEGAMLGGVHVDGFLKPIEGKKSWVYNKKKQSKRKKPSSKSK